MTRARLLVLSCLLGIAPRSAQSQSPSHPPIDPVFERIIASQPDYRDPGTRRLEVLTEIWGNAALYHPVPSAARLHWDDVLVNAVREIGAVRTEGEFAAMLNRVVYAPLHDPLAFVTTISKNDSVSNYPPPLEGSWLAPGTAYVSATDRVYVGPWELGDTRWHEFATKLRAVIDSLARQQEIKQLVVDMRSQSRTSYRPGTPAAWLGMWTPRPIIMGQDLSILRDTDVGDLAEVKWIVSPRETLTPFGPELSVPTVFLVNRTSYPPAEKALDAIRSTRRDIAVVFEESGPIPNMGYNAWQSWYPDSLLLPHSHTAIISADGSLGSVTDEISPRFIPRDEINEIAVRALAARAAQRPRDQFHFEDARIPEDTVSMGPLSREERVAGLLKVWFWVAHSYAYLDDASVDWRHLLPTWLPRVESAKDDHAYYRVLEQIGALLNDNHTWVQHPVVQDDGMVPPPGGFFWTAPVFFAQLDERLAVVRVDTTGAALGIAPGDEVLSIDGKGVHQLESELYPYQSISKPIHRVRLRSYILGAKGSIMTLKLRTPTGVHEVKLPRSRRWRTIYERVFPEHPAFAVLPGNIGYVNVGLMTTRQTFDSAMKAIADTRGLILDDRNPAAADAEFNVQRFLTAPGPWMMWINAVSYMHGGYSPVRGYGLARQWDVPPSPEAQFKKPIVAMIGKDLVSRGESIAQWLRNANRAILIGESTSGTYGSRQTITVPGGAIFSFTGNRALFPDGRKYHGIGVVPDVVVAPTFRGLRERRDEVYDTAIATIDRILAHSPGSRNRGVLKDDRVREHK